MEWWLDTLAPVGLALLGALTAAGVVAFAMRRAQRRIVFAASAGLLVGTCCLALDQGIEWLRQPEPYPLGVTSPAVALAEGEFAPDFTLPEVRTGQVVNLTAFRRDGPVVLIFGSWG